MRELLLFFLLFFSQSVPIVHATPGENSEPARLASKSLITDVLVAGTILVAVGDRGHILRATQEEGAWEQVLSPTRSLLTALASDQAGGIVAVGHAGTVLVSKDQGSSWSLTRTAESKDEALLDVGFLSPLHGLAVGSYGTALETSDGGMTWSEFALAEEEDRHLYGIIQLTSGSLFIVGESGVLYRKSNQAQTWEQLTSPYEGTLFGGVGCADNTLLVFGLRGHVFRSTDEGNSWTEVPTSSTLSLYTGLYRPSGELLLGGAGGLLLRSHSCEAALTKEIRPDRRAITALTSLASSRVLVAGETGFAELIP